MFCRMKKINVRFEKEKTLNDTYLDQNTYTLTFDANGGTGVTPPVTGLYSGSEVTLPAFGFTKTGHTDIRCCRRL